jgi:hypothetical protein
MFKRTIQFLAFAFIHVFTIKYEHCTFTCVISDIFAFDLTDVIVFLQCYKLSHRGL